MVTSAATLVPPPPPALRVHRVTSDSITLRWAPGSTGHAPVTGYRLQYKVTYGEWTERLVSSWDMVTICCYCSLMARSASTRRSTP